MYNQATLMGRITHDLELKTTSSGVNVCSFQIAVDRRYQQKGEERKSDFFTVVNTQARTALRLGSRKSLQIGFASRVKRL